jgi:hypothetical protein
MTADSGQEKPAAFPLGAAYPPPHPKAKFCTEARANFKILACCQSNAGQGGLNPFIHESRPTQEAGKRPLVRRRQAAGEFGPQGERIFHSRSRPDLPQVR